MMNVRPRACDVVLLCVQLCYISFISLLTHLSHSTILNFKLKIIIKRKSPERKNATQNVIVKYQAFLAFETYFLLIKIKFTLFL